MRGLDYYTRTAFEWISGVLAENKAGTINAGGRYDGLAEQLGGQPTPGVGFAMGLDRVLLAMEGEGIRGAGRSHALAVSWWRSETGRRRRVGAWWRSCGTPGCRRCGRSRNVR